MTSGAVSALQDESSMPSLVLQGVQSIYKLTARKHKQLRQECEELIQSIQRDDEAAKAAQQQLLQQQQPATSPTSSSSSPPLPPPMADTDADKYFLPFKLACESDNSRMAAVALNQIEKLIAYGYLDGASVADPNVYPPRKSEEGKAPSAADGGGGGSVNKAATAGAAAEQKGGKDSSKDKDRGSGSSADSSRRLISVIVDTVYDASLNKDRDVQLQAVKCILTALTSTTCSVHGQTLVTASYACWNIYLQASDDTIRNTAKAALTQTFSLVFQRMESFGSQLKQMQQSAALQPTPAATTNSKSTVETKGGVTENSSTAAANASNKADLAQQTADRNQKEAEERKYEEKEGETQSQPPPQQQQQQRAAHDDGTIKQSVEEEEEKAGSDASDSDPQPVTAVSTNSSSDMPPSSPTVSPPPTVHPAVSASVPVSSSAAAMPPASPSSASSSSTPAAADDSASRPPPGKRGYCVVCSKPANYYCLQTRDSVCSVDCKLVNLQRRDKKSTIASDVHAKIQKKFVILQTDAFMLLRALIRLSKKPLPSPAEPSAVDSKLLSLELLLTILKQPGVTFKSSEQFVSLVKTDVTDVILKNSDASIEALFSLSSSLFVALVRHFRQHLHRIIGPVLDSIYLPYIASNNSSYEVKYASLLVLKQICSDCSIILELFLNYDCDISSYNTFQKIATTLEKTVQGSYFAQVELTQLQENRLKMLGLEALVDTIRSLVEWTQRGEQWESRERAAAAKRKEERDKGEEAQNSGSGTPTSTTASSHFASNAPRGSPSSPSSSSHTGGTLAAPEAAAEDGDDPRSPAHHEDTYVAASSTSSTFSSQFHQLRQQKQKLDTGILRFNMKPKKGLQYLVEHGLLENSPESVAAFFHANPALDKTVVGDFMGEDVEFNKKVLHAFAQQMDFRSLSFDEAIRTYVSGFRLPGEAQKIDRMMLEFASQYHINNPGRFSSADTAYVLAYSVIMLNSDQHNPQVKNRMTKEEFFKNNRGIDNGKDIESDFLSYIFDRIATNEIKMKDDPYKTAVKTAVGGEMSGQTRVVAFMKESQQMVKKTQDLIKNIGKGREKGRGLDDQTDDGDSGAGSSSRGAARGGSKGDKPFYLSQDSDWQACGAMFEILWYPSLATFSVLLEENESEQLIALCLEGYRCAIRISNALNMDTSRLAFVTSLKKFTLLGSSKEMKAKNISAVQMLLTIVNTEGNYLKESWAEVLMCISEVERLHLIATSNKPDVDVFVGETQVVQPAARAAHSHSVLLHQQSQQSLVAAPSQQVSTRGVANREVDSANAGKLLLDVALIERVFINSANLDGDAVVDFVSALRSVSEHELSGVQPRVFSLQKIVEITYYNMGRIRLVWSRIWNILSDFFVKAGCHYNLGVSLYAVDSLRQLAMKFLEKDELSSFSYQKQFFRPFELIMAANASVEARELIVQCLSRMVLARKRNIKSGWRGVFVVLAIAAQQPHSALIQSSADLLSTIMEQHFTLITELDTMEECVNALVSFASQSTYLDVSLQAVHYLTLCATHMGSIPVGDAASRSATTTPRHRSGSISGANGSSLVPPTGQSQLSAALAAEGDLSLSSVQHAGGAAVSVALHSASAPSTPAHLPAQPPLLPTMSSVSQANLLKVWFLLLTGLSRLVSDSRVEVRTLSLNTLYSILNENGEVFSASTWRAIYHGVLLPQFDDIRHHIDEHAAANSNGTPLSHSRSVSLDQDDDEPLTPDTPHPDSLSSWLQTTCHTALSSLVLLFCRFYSTTYFLLPDLLTLLAGCVSSELEQLAQSGVESLALLIRDSSRQWSVGSTWIVLEAVLEIVKRTLPTQLLSGKVRRTLGLPPLATSDRSALNPQADQQHRNNKQGDDAQAEEIAANSARAEDGSKSSASGAQRVTPSANDTTSSSAAETSSNDSTRQRSTLDPPPASTPTLLLSFSAPLIATRCKIQLLLLQSLFDALQACFPRREGSVQSMLPSAQQSRSDDHFRRPSMTQLSLPSSAPSMSPASRSSSVSARGSVSESASNTSSAEAETHSQSLPAPSAASERSVTASSSTSDSTATSDSLDGRYLHRDDQRVFGHFLPAHLLHCLSIFSLTLSFSHTFNSDIALRKRLYQAGFIMEQAGRLPQLFELEARVTRFAWSSMFRVWKEGGVKERAAGSTGAAINGDEHTQHEFVDLGMEAMQDIASGKEADVLTSPLVASILASGPQLPYASAYHSTVALCYHRLSLLTTRLLTDYLTKTQAGQLVALEHVDEVVVTMVDSYASLRLSLFVCDMDVIVPLFGELAEWGSLNVRGAVRRWIQGKGLRIMHVAFARAQHEHEIDQLFEEDVDDGEPHPPQQQAAPVHQQPQQEQQQHEPAVTTAAEINEELVSDRVSTPSHADTNGSSNEHHTAVIVTDSAETAAAHQASDG